MTKENDTSDTVDHIVDEDGDVVFVVGEYPSYNVQVSSKILIVASPVWKAMFSRRFSEGQKLSAGSSAENGPVKIELLDDDRDGLLLLCKVLHFQTTKDIQGIHVLDAIATISDKYQCTPAIKYPSTVWLTEYLSHIGETGYESLLTICYKFDNAAMFESYTKELIQRNTDGFKKLAGYNSEDILPPQTYGKSYVCC